MPPWPIGVFASIDAGLGVHLDVARALVDRTDLGVAVELLDRIVLRVAVAAEEFHRERGHALAHL